jgi:RNA polymerase sigma-70 factor, ECF subfamily
VATAATTEAGQVALRNRLDADCGRCHSRPWIGDPALAMQFLRQKDAPVTLDRQRCRETFSMDKSPGPEEWPQWLEDHAGPLLLFARQQTRTAADAEDVLQESLVEAWDRAGQDGPPPLPLVYATIRRRAIDQARREDRRRQREEASVNPEQAWFDAGLADGEKRQQVEAGMKGLPPIYREVVTLKIWGELTFAQIAEVLGIPANTAASRYRYGLEALRKSLKDLTP